MWQVVGDELSVAVGIAISIAPIIGLIVILTGDRARSSGVAFGLGWWFGVTGALALFALLGSAVDVSDADSAADQGLDVIALILALLFLWLAYRSLRNRPIPGETSAEPKWLGAVDGLAPLPAFGLAAAIVVFNAKNLPLLLKMGGEIARSGLDGTEGAITVIVLGIVCSLGALIPLTVYFAGGSSAQRVLADWRLWLVRNNSTVMAVLFTILGVKSLGNAVGGLL